MGLKLTPNFHSRLPLARLAAAVGKSWRASAVSAESKWGRATRGWCRLDALFASLGDAAATKFHLLISSSAKFDCVHLPLELPAPTTTDPKDNIRGPEPLTTYDCTTVSAFLRRCATDRLFLPLYDFHPTFAWAPFVCCWCRLPLVLSRCQPEPPTITTGAPTSLVNQGHSYTSPTSVTRLHPTDPDRLDLEESP